MPATISIRHDSTLPLSATSSGATEPTPELRDARTPGAVARASTTPAGTIPPAPISSAAVPDTRDAGRPIADAALRTDTGTTDTADAAGADSTSLTDLSVDRGPARVSERAPAGPSHDVQHAPLARHNIGHITQLSTQYPDRQIELILAPEELGAIRMTFANADGAMTMSIAADRPETLDLLRRNIDLLAQDFRDLGYGDVNFSFSAGSNASSAGHQRELLEQTDTDVPSSPSSLVPTGISRSTQALSDARTATGSGLDVRL